MFHLFLVVIILYIKKNLYYEWKKITGPYWIYFPISGLLFLIISIISSSSTLNQILINVLLATIRLYATISIMALYIIESKSYNTLLAIRSLWYASGINIFLIDRIVLFFEISIRFFPTIQEQWHSTARSQKALCSSLSQNYYKRIIQNAKLISDFIILNLRRTDRLVENMRMRGYGSKARRSIFPFIKLRLFDLTLFIGFSIIIFGVHNIV